MRWAALLLLLTTACSDSEPSGARIFELRPTALAPGDPLLIIGAGFGEAGRVSVGGRPIEVLEWSSDRLEVELPADSSGGHTYVVVSPLEGRPSPPAALFVQGPSYPSVDPPRALPPPRPGPRPIDMGPPPPRDFGADRPEPSRDLSVTFESDSNADNTLRLATVDEGRRLLVGLRLPAGVNAWGVAAHLSYDPNLLSYVEAELDAEHAVVREIGPGRLAMGAVRPRDLVFVFAPVGPGEGRVEITGRNSALRGPGNTPIPGVLFRGGSVRVVER